MNIDNVEIFSEDVCLPVGSEGVPLHHLVDDDPGGAAWNRRSSRRNDAEKQEQKDLHPIWNQKYKQAERQEPDRVKGTESYLESET